MQFIPFDIPGPHLVVPQRHGDRRGYFVESYVRNVFNAGIGRDVDFVQDNRSLSAQAGTLRGLHYQAPPRAQGKLIGVLSGAVVDIAVDARRGSPTYGQHVRAELSADNARQLWVPEGFIHGFATLTPDTLIAYKVTDTFARETEGGVRFDSLDLDWGIDPAQAILSDRDTALPAFADWESPFTWTPV